MPSGPALKEATYRAARVSKQAVDRAEINVVVFEKVMVLEMGGIILIIGRRHFL